MKSNSSPSWLLTVNHFTKMTQEAEPRFQPRPALTTVLRVTKAGVRAPGPRAGTQESETVPGQKQRSSQQGGIPSPRFEQSCGFQSRLRWGVARAGPQTRVPSVSLSWVQTEEPCGRGAHSVPRKGHVASWGTEGGKGCILLWGHGPFPGPRA